MTMDRRSTMIALGALLMPFGTNGMRATGKVVQDPKLRVAVSLTLAGGKPQQERFEPFRPLPGKK
jgi:hypothetical protein